MLRLDPSDDGLLSDRPHRTRSDYLLDSDNSEADVLEIEWESKFFPPEFWPSPGDSAWVLGRWVFDCGHPPFYTEIHPIVGVAVHRPRLEATSGWQPLLALASWVALIGADSL